MEAFRRKIGLQGRREGKERPYYPGVSPGVPVRKGVQGVKGMYEIQTAPNSKFVSFDRRRRLRDRLFGRKQRPEPK